MEILDVSYWYGRPGIDDTEYENGVEHLDVTLKDSDGFEYTIKGIEQYRNIIEEPSDVVDRLVLKMVDKVKENMPRDEITPEFLTELQNSIAQMVDYEWDKDPKNFTKEEWNDMKGFFTEEEWKEGLRVIEEKEKEKDGLER